MNTYGASVYDGSEVIFSGGHQWANENLRCPVNHGECLNYGSTFTLALENIVSAENTPADGSTTNIAIQYVACHESNGLCFEWHFIANTPGVPNGRCKCGRRDPNDCCETIYSGIGPTNTSAWDLVRLYRQSGSGNLWFDRIAIGEYADWVLRSTSASNTTRPAPPQGLVIR